MVLRVVKYILSLIIATGFPNITFGQCALEITSQPVFPDVVCAGPGSVKLSVTAQIIDGGSLSYQWYFNGQKLLNAVSSNYTVNSLQESNNGSYTVVVLGACGGKLQSITSNNAILEVAKIPVITSSPNDQSVCNGSSVNLSVSGNSRLGGALTYEWKNINVNEVVSTNSNYSLTSFNNTNESQYSVKLSNTCGSTTSKFTLSKKDKPVTTAVNGLNTISSCVGSPAIFETQTLDNNGGKTTYEWYKVVGDVAQSIPGITLSFLSFPSVNSTDAGIYRVFSRNTCGRSESALDFVLTTPTSKPTIITQPTYSEINCNNYELRIMTTANSEVGTVTFLWKKDGGNVSNNATITSNNLGNTSTLSILEPSLSDNGLYEVFISNGCGSVKTNSVQVKVNVVKPVFTIQPISSFICENTSFNSEPSVRDETSFDYTYAWFKSGNSNPIATTKKLEFNSFVEANDGTYRLHVTDVCNTTVKSDLVSFKMARIPEIITQPSLGITTACLNQDLSLLVSCKQSFSGTVQFQWFKNNNILTGEIANVLYLNKISNVGQGSYRVQVKNECGITQSNLVPINLGASPTLISKSSDTLFCLGSKMVLNVEANTNNGGQLRYSWTSSTTGGISNGNSSYSVNSFSNNDAATYQIQISNDCGAIIDPVVIKINTLALPIINSFTSSSSELCAGGSIDFTIKAQGIVNMYTWYKGNVEIQSEGTSYQIVSVNLLDAGNYKVTASNLCGTVSSDLISITIKDKPTITNQPQENINCTTNRTLSLSTNGISNGGGTISFQWYKNGNALGIGTTSTINFTGIDESYNGIYTVVLTNSCGSSNSEPANVVIDLKVPEILQDLEDRTICAGTPLIMTLRVKDQGTKTFRYQWIKDGVDVIGANSNSFSRDEALVTHQGQYRVGVTGLCGLTALSSISNVIINSKPSPNFTVDSKSSQCLVGNLFEFTDITSGTFNREWFFDDGTSEVNRTNVKHSYEKDGIYAVMLKLTSGNGCSGTMTKNITVATIPTIIDQLKSQISCLNGDVSLNINATDNYGGTIKYVWKKDNALINWAPSTTGSLILNGLRKSDEGFYGVTISNSCGSINGDSAYLQIADKPVFLKNVTSKAICENSVDTIFANATSVMASITYQWYRDNQFFKTTNVPYLAFTNFSDNGAGTFYVTAQNSCGSSNSNTFALNVKLKPIWIGRPIKDTTCFNQTKLIETSFLSNIDDAVDLQWYKNDTILLGEKSNKIMSVINQDGDTRFKLVATNSCGFVDNLVRTTFANRINAQFKIDTTDACKSQLKMNITNNSVRNAFQLSSWKVDYGDGFVETMNISSPTTTYKYSTTGFFTVSLTAKDESGCESVPIQKIYYNAEKTIADFLFNDTCYGIPVEFINRTKPGQGNSGIASLIWRTGNGVNIFDTSSSVKYLYTRPGVFTVTMIARGRNSCEVDSITKLLTVNSRPEFFVDSVNGCRGDLSVTIKNRTFSPSIENYLWSIDFGDGFVVNNLDSLIPEVRHDYKKIGKYPVTITTSGNQSCQNQVINSLVYNYGKSTANFKINDTCNGNASTIVNLAKKGFGIEKYEFIKWKFDDQWVDDSSMQFNYFKSKPGRYQATMYVKGENNCDVDSISKYFTVVGNPIFKLDTIDACKEQLKITIQNENYQSSFMNFKWTVNSGDGSTPQTFDSTKASYTYAYKFGGKFGITINSVGDLACQNIRQDYTVYNFGKSESNFYYLDTCLGQDTKFYNSSSLGYGSDAYSLYQWVINGDTLSEDPTKTVLAKFKSAGSFKVTLFTMGNKSCLVDTIQLIPTIVGYPIANFTHVDSCASFNVFFQDKSKSTLYDTLNQWQWFFQDGTPPSFEKNPIHIFKNPGSYKVNLSVQSKTCPSFVDDTTINLNIIKARENKRYPNYYSVQGRLNTLRSNIGGRSYSWSPQFNLSNTAIAYPILNPDFSKREYIVKITDSSGCINTDSLLVYGFKQSNIYLPTAFSPNFDGNNDLYKPEYVYIKSLEYFTILDQFSNKVFETKDLGIYWDGTFNGKILPSGTYLVIISGIDNDGNRIQRKNTFILLR